ncbi:MAG: hypothetical protein ACI4L9_07285 [Candidatus Coproplasma sp.]
MEENKVKVLSELYSVRSVLSVVSKNEDEVQNIIDEEIEPQRQTTEKIEKQNNSLRGYIERNCRNELIYKNKISACQKQIQEIEESINQNTGLIAECNDKIEKVKKVFWKDVIVKTLWWMLILFIPTVFVLGGLGGVLIANLAYSSGNPALTITLSVIVCILIWILVSFLFQLKSLKENKDIIKDNKKKIEETEELNDKLKIEIQDIEKQIEEYNSELGRSGVYTQEGLQKIKEIEREEKRIEEIKANINQCVERINVIKGKSEKIIEKARNIYKLLDLRDWINVDLIIFYYETGRADTIKEALYQVDRERQNQSLVSALHIASESICKTVYYSIAALSESLNRSFEMLASEIKYQNEQTRIEFEKNIQKSNMLLERQSEETARLAQINCSAQELNKALLEKISVSSDRLVEDMESQLRAEGITY